MASAPQPNLPLFYNDLMPLNSRDHKGWKAKKFDDASFVADTHAIPLTVDEFIDAQRSYPIVFTTTDEPLPIVLLGMNEGVNTFIGPDNQFEQNAYIPAYIRRYPFMLARLKQDSDDMSLCFDPTSGIIGEFKDGDAVFGDDDKPSEYVDNILKFCEQFEQSGQRTKAFIEQLQENDLLMDGEIAITQNDNPDKPFVYRGFKMVDENKLRELPDAKVVEFHKNGIMVLITAHLYSLNLMRNIFARQAQQGKVPESQNAAV